MSDRLEQLQQLFAADPGDADLPYMIALEHAKADDPAEAVAWLDKALAINPHYHYAYFQKAKVLDGDGEEADAIAAVDEGIKMANQAIADGKPDAAKALGELQELRQMIAG